MRKRACAALRSRVGIRERARLDYGGIFMQANYQNVTLTGGFWKAKEDLNRDVTIDAVYNRFDETGRIAAFRCDWKDGMPYRPHIFWDSDVAKWMEGAA